MTPIYFDLETLPDPRGPAAYSHRVKADGRLKDPERIAADVAAKSIELWKETSLNPLMGFIYVIAFAVGDGPVESLVGEERDILSAFRQRMDGRKLVAFNGKSFDGPYLRVRGLRYGLYFPKFVVDPREELLGYDMKRQPFTTLADFAEYLGITHSDDVKGSEVSTLWFTNPEKVVSHARSDVEVLREISRRVFPDGV